ncbi:MAG: MoxR family ATPase [Candidatus Tectomicrobia bacterium]|uniref:MoxR family ATPase n=1 Tax=Tectimicrobiota bacterium TaxID=2528274 RepID=A0A932HZP2_UNCTE|nr:MoxR family ATPase [Candidatus Tectomicrobia bacterium]
MFPSTDKVRTSLAGQSYIASREICTALYLAEGMGKPVLVEGPAGVGKTELAKVWAAATGRNLIRLQCYEGLDEAKALYEWEYSKQMLYTQLLRDKLQQVLSDARTLGEAADRVAKEEDIFFSERFLLSRPLLRAIKAEEPTLLLVDEVDRSDAEFEAFLLEVLSDFQVSIPEVGTIRAPKPPAVVLTSNNTRELSEALKRRCLYLFIGYPSSEAELEVVRLKVPGLAAELAKEVVALVQSLREMDLKKHPSVSETIDWAKALVMLNVKHLDEATLDSTLTVLLKHEQDVLRARRVLESRQAKGMAAEAMRRQGAGRPDAGENGEQEWPPSSRRRRRDHRFENPYQRGLPED